MQGMTQQVYDCINRLNKLFKHINMHAVYDNGGIDLIYSKEEEQSYRAKRIEVKSIDLTGYIEASLKKQAFILRDGREVSFSPEIQRNTNDCSVIYKLEVTKRKEKDKTGKLVDVQEPVIDRLCMQFKGQTLEEVEFTSRRPMDDKEMPLDQIFLIDRPDYKFLIYSCRRDDYPGSNRNTGLLRGLSYEYKVSRATGLPEYDINTK